MNAHDPSHDNDNSEELEAFDIIMNEAQKIKKKEEWKKKLKELNKEQNTVKNGFSWKWLGIAAFIGLILCVILYYSKKEIKIQDEAIQYAMNTDVYFNTASTTRGEGGIQSDFINSTRSRLDENLQNNNLDAALGQFKEIESQGDLTLEDKFNYAVVLLKVKNSDTEKAAILLNEVLNENTRFQAEALWFTALTSIIEDDKVRAKEKLNELIKYKYKRSEAIKLLDQLEIN